MLRYVFVVLVLLVAQPVQAQTPTRELLLADRTYYVRSDGNDDNACLTDSSEGACASWNGALARVGLLDFGNRSVTVQHGSEGPHTFTAQIRVPSTVGGGGLRLAGHSAPGETVISVTNLDAMTITRSSANVSLRDLTIQVESDAAHHPSGVVVLNGSILNIEEGVIFGPVPFAHIFVHDRQSIAYLLRSRYAVSGSADYHIYVSAGFAYLEFAAITLVNTPEWRGAFIGIGNGGGMQAVGTTFAGEALGQRYSVGANGTLNASGADPLSFPGSLPGSTSGGGQYQ